MGKLLDYIAKETRGECFASFKYCYDNMLPPNIEYEAKEESYINMKVKYVFIQEREKKVFDIDARYFIKAILKDVLNGEIKVIAPGLKSTK